MSNLTTFEMGMAAVEKKIAKLGASDIEKVKLGNKTSLQFSVGKEKTQYTIATRSKKVGTWQTTIDYGQATQENLSERNFWVFIDLDNIEKPKFYIVPKWWILNDIYEAHQKYLNKYMGSRKYNPYSKHHAIQLSRIKQWENRWDLIPFEENTGQNPNRIKENDPVGRLAKKIDVFYFEKGISPTNFTCRYLSSCISQAQDQEKFTKGHGIWIGSEYEKGNIPRLLFLSLDSGSAEHDPNMRTMKAAERWNLNWLPGSGDKNRHWYRTQQFAWHIFHEYNKAFHTGLDIGSVDKKFDFDPVTEIHKIKPYYAAANSAKCCMNNDHRSKADKVLFENCRNHIIGEINILAPDILVTQGKYARMVAEQIPVNKIVFCKNISGASRTEDDFHIMQVNNERELIWIHHYHPTNFGTFKKNRDQYVTYAKEAVGFLKSGRIDPAKMSMARSAPKTKQKHNKSTATQRIIKRQIKQPRPVSGTACSKVADFYYNQQTRYRRGCATDKIVFEMEKLCKKGIFEISIDGLILIVKRKHPELKARRVTEVVNWAKSEKYVDVLMPGKKISIKPVN